MKEKKMIHYMYIVYFIVSLFKVINAFDVNEDDIISKLLTNNNKVILEINSEINISKEVK